MEQQIKKEKEQFLLKVSVSVIVAMDSAPPFSGFKLILGVKLKPTKCASQQRKKQHLLPRRYFCAAASNF